MTDDRGMDAQDNAWAQLARSIGQKETMIRHLREGRDAMAEDARQFRKVISSLSAENRALMDERDALTAWRENVIAKWESMSLRPHAGELMDLGNAILDSPEYTERRYERQVEALKAEALEQEANCVMADAGYLESFRREVAGRLIGRAAELRRQGAAHEADAP